MLPFPATVRMKAPENSPAAGTAPETARDGLLNSLDLVYERPGVG